MLPTENQRAIIAHPGNQPGDWKNLEAPAARALLIWIAANIKPSKRLSVWSSYGAKHLYERQTGNYVSNGQFKAAMLISGYRPALDDTRLHANWRFYAGYK